MFKTDTVFSSKARNLYKRERGASERASILRCLRDIVPFDSGSIRTRVNVKNALNDIMTQLTSTSSVTASNDTTYSERLPPMCNIKVHH